MYKRAIENNPKKSNAYVLLANLYSNEGRIEEAIETYRKALHVDPNNAETFVLLGNAHYLGNDIDQAIQSYRAAIAIAPTNDEYKLIYSQVMEDYIEMAHKG